MKNPIFPLLVATFMIISTASAHDIHRQASDHFHPAPLYTHSVSSAYNHGLSHSYKQNYYRPYNYSHPVAQNYTTNTATYYTRNFPVTKSYTYLTTPNTTIHQPPFAYSSCASHCTQTQKRIMITKNIGTNTKTYRAPSEYSAQQKIMITPQKRSFNYQNPVFQSMTYVSPKQKHKLNNKTCYRCAY